MITVDCEQLSPEWHAAKVGVASTSNFSRVITPSGSRSTQDTAYLYELVAEYIHGERKYVRPSYWMERGIEMEPQARAMYELITGETVTQVGFVYKDSDRLVGCSPDGLKKRRRRGLEIKCPAPLTHLAYLLEGVCPKEYVSQVQGAMWITGYKTWDFMSFHPDYDSLVITVERDDDYQAALDKIMPPFLKKLAALRASDRVQALRNQRLEKAA